MVADFGLNLIGEGVESSILTFSANEDDHAEEKMRDEETT